MVVEEAVDIDTVFNEALHPLSPCLEFLGAVDLDAVKMLNILTPVHFENPFDKRPQFNSSRGFWFEELLKRSPHSSERCLLKHRMAEAHQLKVEHVDSGNIETDRFFSYVMVRPGLMIRVSYGCG